MHGHARARVGILANNASLVSLIAWSCMSEPSARARGRAHASRTAVHLYTVTGSKKGFSDVALFGETNFGRKVAKFGRAQNQRPKIRHGVEPSCAL
jgi:hypothetical protein